jgi:hypothetical protein
MNEEFDNHSSQETTQDPQKEQLTLLRGIYQLSQGYTDLQKSLMEYLINIGEMDVDILGNIPDEVFDRALTPPKVHAELSDRALKGDLAATKSMIQEFRFAQENGESSNDIVLKPLVVKILRQLLEPETRYQDSIRNRPLQTSNEPIEPDSVFDPHASLLRKYVLNGHPIIPGQSAVNRSFGVLFEDLGHTITAVRRTDQREEYVGLQFQLYTLESSWERNHPGHQFYSEETESPISNT